MWDFCGVLAVQLLIIKPKISDEEFLSWVRRIPEPARRKYDSRTLAMLPLTILLRDVSLIQKLLKR